MSENIYKRGAVWWCRYQVDGEEFRESLRTGDREIALKRAKEKRKRAVAKSVGDGQMPFEDALIEWSASLEEDETVSATTAERYLCSFRQIDHHLKGKFVDEIDTPLVKTIVKERRDGGISNATVKRDLTALSQFIEYCVDEGWRDEADGNPALSRAKKTRERRSPIVLPTEADIELVIAKAPGNFAHLIRSAWYTGCRQRELVGAERPRLDHRRKQLTVIGKRNKLRTVSLWRAGAYETMKSIIPFVGSPWLFHHDGEPYRSVASRFRTLVLAVQESAQKAGTEFRPFRFHDLRHRYAVDALKSGRSIYTVQQDLGHRSVKTTEIYLAYLTPEEAEAAQKAAHGA